MNLKRKVLALAAWTFNLNLSFSKQSGISTSLISGAFDASAISAEARALHVYP